MTYPCKMGIQSFTNEDPGIYGVQGLESKNLSKGNIHYIPTSNFQNVTNLYCLCSLKLNKVIMYLNGEIPNRKL